jgi:hypothetical protein
MENLRNMIALSLMFCPFFYLRVHLYVYFAFTTETIDARDAGNSRYLLVSIWLMIARDAGNPF